MIVKDKQSILALPSTSCLFVKVSVFESEAAKAAKAAPKRPETLPPNPQPFQQTPTTGLGKSGTRPVIGQHLSDNHEPAYRAGTKY